MRGPATVWPLLLLALVAGAAADSVLGPFNGVNYTIGTTTGVYKDIEDRLQAQPWWNNKDFAKALAVAVGNRFGRPNLIDQWPGEWGPFAAVSTATDPAAVDAFGHWGGGSIYEAYEAQILNVQDSLVWLVAVSYRMSSNPTYGENVTLELEEGEGLRTKKLHCILGYDQVGTRHRWGCDYQFCTHALPVTGLL